MLEGFLDPKELDSDAYFDLSEDIHRQLAKFGEVQSFKILRKCENYSHPGRVLAKYHRVEAAILARFTLSGMKFGGKAVTTSFYDVRRFDAGMYD